MESLLVTGGAGFIGSNFVHHVLAKYPECKVTVYDKLTYAGNLDNLRDIADDPRYSFVRGDICDGALVEQVVQEHKIDSIVNFAAETHVDRSILEPGSFIHTDVYGTHVLLEAVRKLGLRRMVHVSTDEVYGSVTEGSSVETDVLLPNSPYSASKAGGDLMCRAFHVTYGVPVVVTRGSNNFGPHQYPEKVIPLFITNALDNKPLPLYGDGLNVRDWIYVLDHCEAIDLMLRERNLVVGILYWYSHFLQSKDGSFSQLRTHICRRDIEITSFVENDWCVRCLKIEIFELRPHVVRISHLLCCLKVLLENISWVSFIFLPI